MSPEFVAPLRKLAAVTVLYKEPYQSLILPIVRCIQCPILEHEKHHQLVKVFGEGFMNEGNVRKWCHLFNRGKADMGNPFASFITAEKPTKLL
jgi:hypothetical protein